MLTVESNFARVNWGHIIVSKRHFSESLFCRNVILPNCLAEKKIYIYITERNLTESSHSEWSNYRNFIMSNIFPNCCSAERYFPESSYNHTSFSRIFVRPNVIFPKYHLPERHFPEIVWSRTLPLKG